MGILAAGAAPENHILQLTADSGLDLTAIDGSGIQYHTIDLAVHADELVQSSINGAGIDLHRTVVDNAVKAGADIGDAKQNTTFHIDRCPRSGLDREQPVIDIIQTREICRKQVNLLI